MDNLLRERAPEARRAAMMHGHGGWSVDLSFLPIALYTVVAVAAVLIVLGFVAYRRARRSGRWDRVMGGTGSDLRSGPRRDLAVLKRRVDEALATARGVLDVMDADETRTGDFELLVGHLEELGARLGTQMELVDAHASDAAIARIVSALAGPVGEMEILAGRVAEALGTALSGTADLELREIDSELSGAVRVLDYRLAALRDLSTIGDVDDGTGREPFRTD
jgi:hypothetical protein